MNRTSDVILECLADGEWHSGAALASTLGLTRGTVGHHVARLRQRGWQVQGQPGTGYRICGPTEPLRRDRLETALAHVRERVSTVELLASVDSTSDYLARRDLPGDGRARVCMAERQTAGRGRRGRDWIAVPGGSIVLSLALSLPAAPAEIVTLGVSTAIAVAETLAATGADSVGIKWPNDIEIDGAKLGGILIDISGSPAGPTRAVIGIGLNYHLPSLAGRGLDREVTDLVHACRQPVPPRELIAGHIVAAVLDACDHLVGEGFEAYRQRWIDLDVLAGQAVRVTPESGPPVEGRAAGIDADGALLVGTSDGEKRFFAGDVRVRASQ